MDRRAYLVGLGAAVGSLAGCTIRGSEDDYDIGMSATDFLPETYEAAVGDTVVWRNTSSRAHTVTAASIPDDADYFASGGYEDLEAARDAWHDGLGGNIDVQETYEHTFSVPGEHHYVCIPHERRGMVGTVVVSE